MRAVSSAVKASKKKTVEERKSAQKFDRRGNRIVESSESEGDDGEEEQESDEDIDVDDLWCGDTYVYC